MLKERPVLRKPIWAIVTKRKVIMEYCNLFRIQMLRERTALTATERHHSREAFWIGPVTWPIIQLTDIFNVAVVVASPITVCVPFK